MYITIGHREYHTKSRSFLTISLKILVYCLFIMTHQQTNLFNQIWSFAKKYSLFVTGRQNLLLSLFQTSNYNFIFAVGGQKYLELNGMYSWNKIDRFFCVDKVDLVCKWAFHYKNHSHRVSWDKEKKVLWIIIVILQQLRFVLEIMFVAIHFNYMWMTNIL